MNEYFGEINANKYSTLIPTNERKAKIKRYQELWSKIRNLIRLITKKSDDYDEKYMKIKFSLYVELTLNIKIEIPSLIIVVRTVFHKNNKYYPNFFLGKCLWKLWII